MTLPHKTYTSQGHAELDEELFRSIHEGYAVRRADGFAAGVAAQASVDTDEYSDIFQGGSPGDYALPITEGVDAMNTAVMRAFRTSAGCWLSRQIDTTTDRQSDASGHTSVLSFTQPWSRGSVLHLNTWIHLGQSNALGVPLSGSRITDALTAAGISSTLAAPTTGRLTDAITPVNTSDSALGRQWAVGGQPNYGPDHALIHTLIEGGYTDIGLVKVAKGATNLAVDWNPEAVSGEQLFQSAVDAFDRARDLWGTCNPGATVQLNVLGVSTVQGEADASVAAYAAAYGTNYVALYDALVAAIPELTVDTPWFQVLLNPAWNPTAGGPVSRTYWQDTFDGQEWAATQRNITNVSTANVTDLEVGDEIHYAEFGRIAIGVDIGERRLAMAA